MSGKRITMRKIRDILRLRHEGGLSIRQIKASTKVSVGGIQQLLAKADVLSLGWPLDPALEASVLAEFADPRVRYIAATGHERVPNDLVLEVHVELTVRRR